MIDDNNQNQTFSMMFIYIYKIEMKQSSGRARAKRATIQQSNIIYHMISYVLLLLLSFLSYSINEVQSAASIVRLHKRIVSGSPLSYKLPWMVTMHDKATGKHFCGASLITPEIAITAAHCLQFLTVEQMSENITASANRNNLELTTVQENGVDYRISGMIMHPQFNQKTFENDIALIRLQPTNETTENQQYLRFVSIDDTNGGLQGRAIASESSSQGIVNVGDSLIASLKQMAIINNVDSDNPLNPNLYIAGFGRTSFKGAVSTIAQEAPVDVALKKKCLVDLKLQFNTDKVVCTVGDNGLSDGCTGDSGFGLFTKQQIIDPQTNSTLHKETLVGVTSFGIGCGTRRTSLLLETRLVPGVYTSAYYFRDFIQQAKQKLESLQL